MSAIEKILKRKPSRKTVRNTLSGFFIFTGIMHFLLPKPFLSIMPKWVPYPEAAVAVSGVAEVAGGAALMGKKYRKWSVPMLILLLIAVYPANIHMALNADKYPVPKWIAWARLPFQPLLIWLVWWSAQKDKPEE